MPNTWQVTTAFQTTTAAPFSTIPGFKKTRFEKLECAFGTILNTQYGIGDTFDFVSVPTSDIISVEFIVAGSTTPIAFFPNTNFASGPLSITTGGATFSYKIQYVRNATTKGGFESLTNVAVTVTA